jgi:GT2 family glycosyltransferase
MPDLSIIIVNYNTYRLTCDCVASLLSHPPAVSFEIILIDNGSTEKPDVPFEIKFPSLYVYKNAANTGFAKAVNKGLEISRSEMILLLNSDTIVNDQSIDTCYQFLRSHDMYAAAGGKLMYPNGVIQHNCQKFPSITHELIHLFRLHKWLLKNRAQELLLGSFFDYNHRIDPDWMWGTFLMFKISSLSKAKKLDDRYFMYGEDMVWCFQWQKRGYEVAFLPNVSVVHDSEPANNSRRQKVKLAHEMHFIRSHHSFLYCLLLILIRTATYTSLSLRNRHYLSLTTITFKMFSMPLPQLLHYNAGP